MTNTNCFSHDITHLHRIYWIKRLSKALLLKKVGFVKNAGEKYTFPKHKENTAEQVKAVWLYEISGEGDAFGELSLVFLPCFKLEYLYT